MARLARRRHASIAPDDTNAYCTFGHALNAAGLMRRSHSERCRARRDQIRKASGRVWQPTGMRRSTSVATAHVSRHCDRRLPGSQTLAGRPVLGVVNSSARGSDAAVQARSCVANLRMSRTHRASHRDPFRPGTLKVLHVRRHQVILPSCHQESQQKRLARLPGENGPSRGFEARTPGRPKGQALSPGADRNVCGRQREQLLTK